jgi:hypothetical protein
MPRSTVGVESVRIQVTGRRGLQTSHDTLYYELETFFCPPLHANTASIKERES